MIRSIRFIAWIAIVAACAACSKQEAPAGGAAASASVASAAASGGASAAPRGSASAAAPSPGAPTAWNGSYEATAGTLHVPEGKEWEGVKFRGEKSESGLGKGAIKLTVAANGTVTGSLDGPLGPGEIAGTVDKTGVITARVTPKEPSLTSFYGTFSGTQKPGAIEGTMKLSQADARVIREATVSLKP